MKEILGIILFGEIILKVFRCFGGKESGCGKSLFVSVCWQLKVKKVKVIDDVSEYFVLEEDK